MAAYAALGSLMHLINEIENHHSPPISLYKQQLQSLIQKVSFLLGFLQGYTSPFTDIDDEADPLEIRIANAAYAAEDVIESHIVEVIKKDRSNDDSEVINLYEDLHQVIEEMDDLIKKVEEVKIHTDKVEVHHQVSSSSSSSFSTTSIVSSDDVLLEIMDQLVGGRPCFQVIPIFGMGGIGKTTLARYIYSQQLIIEYFDICAWAVISQQYNTREILIELLSQATKQKKEKLSGRSEDELGLALHKHLFGRRFLIVMDDMWSVDAWDETQRFLPNNENGSRILVTTRLSQLSSQLNSNYRHQMDFLDEVKSGDLFFKTVFGEEICPFELEKIGNEIVKNCKGLPLSIVVVGGLLRKVEHTQACWESIRNNLASIVNLEHDKHSLRLLKMSYDHLPVHLKPCFLFMGAFKEDAPIRVSRVIKLWHCEGFLKPMNSKSLKTIAKGLLKDLVDRNLIQIDKLGSTGNIKYCKVHDLLRDLCMRESQKYGFHHVIGVGSSSQVISSPRRVTIRGYTSKPKVHDALLSMLNIRSAICEKQTAVSRFQNFGLLRIFEAQHNIPCRRYVDEVAFHCVNLRYLAVTVDSMSVFFSSRNVLWNLHTLIVVSRGGHCNAPDGIWEMPQFRHIEFIGASHLCLPDPHPSNGRDDVVGMKNLEILKGVKNFKCSEEVVKRIPNIKKLKITYYDSEGFDYDDYYCLSNIRRLCNLESLEVMCDGWFRRAVASSLHELTFPHSLNSLSLVMSSRESEFEFEWEEMLERIGSLPLLQKLILYFGRFGSGKWETVEGHFPSLKFLELSLCRGLRHWTAQESSIFPSLEQLNLRHLKDLKEIPSEIGDISTLREIHVFWCSESVVMSARAMVEKQVELQGEQLPFHVKVRLYHKNEALLNLAGPNFEVA